MIWIIIGIWIGCGIVAAFLDARKEGVLTLGWLITCSVFGGIALVNNLAAMIPTYRVLWRKK